ncbi:MAG: hypothetical protein PHR36_04710 [Patescibacteria group bacterium]|nr:hypothetical protein [Patescibacteria group bacterium]
MLFKKEKANKYNKRGLSFIVGFLIFLFLSASFLFAAKPAYAQLAVVDVVTHGLLTVTEAANKVRTTLEYAIRKGSSQALQRASLYALKKIAFDTATWIGSGGKGQKPLFVTEGWGKYLENVGNQAGGEFIESIGRNWDFNLCEPDLAVKTRIGLGLVQQQKPKAPDCTLSEMYKNWDKELRDPNFLRKFQAAFDPAQSDLGIALSLQTGIMEEQRKTREDKEKELVAKGGWLDIRNIAGKTSSPPNTAQTELNIALDLYKGNFGKFTGDALVDAINVFLNQLAITSFNTAMRKLASGSGPSSSPYSGDYGGLADYEASPASGANGLSRKLLEARFDTRADYDILAELSMCSDPSKAGPTNCVIDEGLRQAIEERKTVGEAMDLGYLKDWSFGFKSGGSGPIEPAYNQGYPYRSMLVLRKYRIIPVGWELAAEYIHSHQEKLRDASLAKMVACFDPDDSYTGYSEDWCRGLVDPNWVLKAPQNFCAKEGFGPEIMSDEITEGKNGIKSRVVYRGDQYCADEQSCIKERNDGSCEAYGYCTQERRSWKFEADSCEPKYNTCQTFRGQNGKTFSYLENTLDYSSCSANSAGCKGYAASFTGYNAGSDSVNWASSGESYFNKNIEKCDQGDEGCHEFIRTKSGLGANLVVNSGFEGSEFGEKIEVSTRGSHKLNNWPVWLFADTNMTAEVIGDAPGKGGKSLHITIDSGNGGLYSYDYSAETWSDKSVFPEGFIMEAGVSYTLSADVYLKEGDRIEAAIGNNDTSFKTFTSTGKNSWEKISISVNNDNNLAANEFYIYGYGAGKVEFYLDNIQFEIGPLATAYKEYGAANVVYEKLAPAYLGCSEANPPSRCQEFVNSCQSADVGCELYTGVADGISLPAKAAINDYCPAACDGFDTYVQAQTSFSGNQAAYLIPKGAKTCSASAAGCDEFTNLDEVARGGEGKEYYTYLRQCVKPDAGCAEFYTWEGSDESGYQLKVFNLKSNGSQPATASDDSSECDETKYNLPATDPGYNPDCRQFYNKEGGISYHLYTRTISCSDNCHSYRRTATDDSQENCEDHGGEWDGGACVYMAIPGEGKSCSASSAGCREYSGNRGSNMRIVLNNDFEGSVQGWSGKPSNAALTVGGHSLETSGNSTVKIIGVSVQKGRSYVLSFIAKAAGATKFNSFKLTGGNNTEEVSLNDALTSEWKLYKFNLAELKHDADIAESLTIAADGNFLIDDIRLTEIVSRYYLIKDSWQTPASCNQDINGNPFPLYMLGCGQYRDRAGNTHYLHSFSQLCQESAVGCELMIDTHNSSGAGAYTSATDPAVAVAADNFTYVVYDAAKKCNQADKGCGRFGSPYKYGEEIVYGDVYLRNNPDKYAEILCDSDAEGCGVWATEDGDSFFKDPGDMVCEWRQVTGETGWDWYKKKVKRCNSVGKICLADKDCVSGESCALEKTDALCPTDNLKTFGYGGEGQAVYQPKDGWVGTCPVAEASCTEYIDPVSRPSPVLSYKAGDKITLEANTLYILKGSGATTLGGCSNVYKLSSSNNDIPRTAATSISADAGKSVVFFNGLNRSNCTASGEGEIKEAMAEYRIREDLSSGDCNGLADFEKGCILFNERAQNGGKGLSTLSWKASEINDGNGVSPVAVSGENNVNQLIKVTPDRVCDQWLACRSYIKKDAKSEPVCFDVGLCNSLDETGNCDNFIVSSQEKVSFTYNNPAQALAFGNFSGYSKIKNEQYYIDKAKQVGEAVSLSNGGFEVSGGNGYPVSWSGASGDSWSRSKFAVLSDASVISLELGKDNFPPEGNNILKVGPGVEVASEELNVSAGAYILSFYVDARKLTGSAGAKILIKPTASDNWLQIDDAPVEGGVIKYALSNPVSFNYSSPKLKIILYSDGDSGYVYFDDIKIKPVLKTGDSNYISQSCRLYPEQDSLACNYFDSAGVVQKGLVGYCLEHDRYPGSSDACLMWYPISKVKGEGIEENAGYKGKYPLYYCTKIDSGNDYGVRLKVELNADDKGYLYIDNDDVIAYVSSSGKYVKTSSRPLSVGKHVVVISGHNKSGDKTFAYVEAKLEDPESSRMDEMITSVEGKYEWKCKSHSGTLPNGIFNKEFQYDNTWKDPTFLGESSVITGAESIWLGDPDEEGEYLGNANIVCRTIIDIRPICREFVEVVSASGNNKVYQSRLSGGDKDIYASVNSFDSGYPQKAFYSSDGQPFGTIIYPEPAANPYEWDASESEGIQPLQYSNSKDTAKMGQQHTIVSDEDMIGLKSLFAKSYNNYTLSYGVCSSKDSSWNGRGCSERQECPGGVCQTSALKCNSNSTNEGAECAVDSCSTDVSQNSCTSIGEVYKCASTGELCCRFGGTASPYCPANSAVCSGGECEAAASAYKCGSGANSGKSCCPTGACARTCINIPTRVCNGDSDCGGAGHCAHNGQSCDDWSDCIVSKTCVEGIMRGVACETNEDCDGLECRTQYSTCPPDPGTCSPSTRCVAGDNVGAVCEATCAGSCQQVYRCSNTGNECCGSDLCQADENNAVCAGGKNAGQVCTSIGGECPNGTCENAGQYILDSNFQNWSPPTVVCVGPRGNYSYCAIAPIIQNISVKGETGNVFIIKNGFVNLKFNSIVDKEQMPLVEYVVDWGDGTETVVSGAEMNSRPNKDDPHEIFHLYSYGDLKNKDITGDSITCAADADGNYCSIKPRVKIKDNWGWCNDGMACNSFVSFGGTIVVRER